MEGIGAIGAFAGVGNTAVTDSPKRVQDAAEQFETLLLTQLLKTSREAGDGGWLGTGDDQAGAMGVEMAEQQFAAILAKSGGLGIARMVAQAIRPNEGDAK